MATHHQLPYVYVIANEQNDLTRKMSKDISIKHINMNTTIKDIKSDNIDKEFDDIDNESNNLDSEIINNIMNFIDIEFHRDCYV
ncbi:36331_t:CDS:2, partial [Racocetra persica]